MTSSDSTTSPWVELGRALAAHRVRLGFSKRKAAAAAGFSEATWRQLEEGKRNLAPGHVVEMSARPETIIAAANAVGMKPGAALSIVGLHTQGTEALVAHMAEMGRQADVAAEPAATTVTQLLADIAVELREMRLEQRRLGDAIAQLVGPAPVPPTRAAQSPRSASSATPGGSR